MSSNPKTSDDAAAATFRPSAIVRVSSFQSIESVDSDSVSTPRNNSMNGANFNNNNNNNATPGAVINGGNSKSRSSVLPNHSTTTHVMNEQLPNSSLTASMLGSQSINNSITSPRHIASTAANFNNDNNNNAKQPVIYQSKKHQQQQQNLRNHQNSNNNVVSTRNHKSHSIASSVGSYPSGLVVGGGGRHGSVFMETVSQPSALVMLNGMLSPTLTATKLIMSKVFAGSFTGSAIAHSASSSSTTSNPQTWSQPTSPTGVVFVSDPAVQSPILSPFSAENNNDAKENNSNNNNNSTNDNAMISPTSASSKENQQQQIPLITLATISEEQQSKLEKAVGYLKSHLFAELVGDIKKTFGQVFAESSMDSEISEQLKNRMGEIIQLISVSDTDVTIGPSDFQKENGNNNHNNNTANHSKSTQLSLLGTQLIDDIINEVSLAEATKISTSATTFEQHPPPKNDNPSHGNSNNHTFGGEFSKNTSHNNSNGLLPAPFPRQQTMLNLNGKNAAGGAQNENDDGDDNEKQTPKSDLEGSSDIENNNNNGNDQQQFTFKRQITTNALTMTPGDSVGLDSAHSKGGDHATNASNSTGASGSPSNSNNNNQKQQQQVAKIIVDGIQQENSHGIFSTVDHPSLIAPSPPRVAPSSSRPPRQQHLHYVGITTSLNTSCEESSNNNSKCSSPQPPQQPLTARGPGSSGNHHLRHFENSPILAESSQQQQNNNEHQKSPKSGLIIATAPLVGTTTNKQQQHTSSPIYLTTMPSLGDLRGFRHVSSNNGCDSLSQQQQQVPGSMSRHLSNMTVAGREFSSFLAATATTEASGNYPNVGNNSRSSNSEQVLLHHINLLEQQLIATAEMENFWKAQFGRLSNTLLNNVLRMERVSSNQQAHANPIFKGLSRERQFFRDQLIMQTQQQNQGNNNNNNLQTSPNRTPPKGAARKSSVAFSPTNANHDPRNPLSHHRSSVQGSSINNNNGHPSPGLNHSHAPRVSMVRFDFMNGERNALNAVSGGGDAGMLEAGSSLTSCPSTGLQGLGRKAGFPSMKLTQVPSMRLGAVPRNVPESHERFHQRLSVARSQSLSAQKIHAALQQHNSGVDDVEDSPDVYDYYTGSSSNLVQNLVQQQQHHQQQNQQIVKPSSPQASPNAMTIKPKPESNGGALIQFIGIGEGSDGDGSANLTSFNSPHNAMKTVQNAAVVNSGVDGPRTSISAGSNGSNPINNNNINPNNNHKPTFNASTASDVSVQSYAPGQLLQVIESNVFAGASTTENILEALDDNQGNGTNYDAGDMPVINHYQVLDKLGKGAQAPVFLAVDNDTMEPVAIKIVHRPVIDPRLLDSPLMAGKRRIIAAVRREIAAMKRCRHPNLVHLLEVIDDSSIDHIFLIIEYMGGGTAQLPRMATDPSTGSKIADGSFNRRYSAKRVIQFGRRLCAALQYLHERRVVHRDLKPENILLRENGEPCIADFGIAELMENMNAVHKELGSDGKVKIRRYSLTEAISRHPLFENSGSGVDGVKEANSQESVNSLLREAAGENGDSKTGRPDESAILPPTVNTSTNIANDSDGDEEHHRPLGQRHQHHQAESSGGKGDQPSFQGTIAFLPPEDLRKMFHVDLSKRKARNLNNGDDSFVTTAGVNASVTSVTFESHLSQIENKFAGDIWALGLTLYSLLTGRLPFPATSMQDYAAHVVLGEIPFPPQGSKAWTSKLCKEEFTDRFPETFGVEPPLAEMDEGVIDAKCHNEIDPNSECAKEKTGPLADLILLLKRMLTKDPEARIDVEACRIAFKKLDRQYNSDLMI